MFYGSQERKRDPRRSTPTKRSNLKRMKKKSKMVNLFSGKGFTLVEVMITLTILGFILLIIFGGFRLSFSAWERGDSTKEELQRRRIITQLISQQIKSIVPYRIKTEKAEGDYLAFQGKS